MPTLPTSPQARKRLAIVWTGVCAFVLLLLFIFRYTVGRDTAEPQEEMNQRLQALYETVSDQTQSFFGGK